MKHCIYLFCIYIFEYDLWIYFCIAHIFSRQEKQRNYGISFLQTNCLIDTQLHSLHEGMKKFHPN